MKKRQAQEVEEIEETEEDEELDPKQLKKKKREEAAEKRRKARKADKAARWSGIILLLIIMIAGFLMWVSGEIKSGSIGDEAPDNSVITPPGRIIVR